MDEDQNLVRLYTTTNEMLQYAVPYLDSESPYLKRYSQKLYISAIDCLKALHNLHKKWSIFNEPELPLFIKEWKRKLDNDYRLLYNAVQ